MTRLRNDLTRVISLVLISLTSSLFTHELSFLGKTEKNAVEWTPCPLKSGDGSETAECAVITVPMYHDDPGGATIQVAVKRKLGQVPHKRQLWFLDGGPGDSARESLVALVNIFTDIDDLDLYTFDHRGVGGTQLLECPEQQRPESDGGREIVASEWDDCIRYLRQHRNDLDALTATETAQDLGFLIELFRKPNVPVFVMGVSYGTYLTNRYLQLFPHQPDGVIMDGLVPADWSFAEFDSALDLAGRKFITACDKDPDCACHFRSDLATVIEKLIQGLEEGLREALD